MTASLDVIQGVLSRFHATRVRQEDWVDTRVHVDTVSVKEFVRNPKLPCAAAPTISSYCTVEETRQLQLTVVVVVDYPDWRVLLFSRTLFAGKKN